MTAVLICLVFLIPATVAGVYYFVLTTIGWTRRAGGVGPLLSWVNMPWVNRGPTPPARRRCPS